LGSLQFRSVEMATLEQGNGQFKHPSLTSFEYEVLPALWHRTGGAEPILIVGASSGSPLNDNPSPTVGTCHARAHNPIRHSTIIGRPRAGWQPKRRLSFPREPGTYPAHRTRMRASKLRIFPRSRPCSLCRRVTRNAAPSPFSAVDQLRNSFIAKSWLSDS
jgi:hypothetical protein